MKGKLAVFSLGRQALLLLFCSGFIVAAAQAQHVASALKSARGQRGSASSRFFAARPKQSSPPAAASPDIVWVQCPPGAQALGATCGTLPVPLDRQHPTGALIEIYFELYLHTEAGRAESVIVPNMGGPDWTTTGFRDMWLSIFSPNMDVHDLLLIDDRGRGNSGLLVCDEVQHGTGSSIYQEVADCAAQLGDDTSSYGTGDIALDVEAVRAALGYDKLDYYGGSYGAMDASAYATRFGQHLRSIILDSPAGPPFLSEWTQKYENADVPTEVRLVCQYSPTCAVDHPDSDGDLAWLIESVRENPVNGNAQDANGNIVTVDFDETMLDGITLYANNGYQNIGELLAATRSLRNGDGLPLLRLGAESGGGLVSDWGDPSVFSIAAFLATSCTDTPMPFNWLSPVTERFEQYAEALSNLPPDYFAPFSKHAATNELSGLPYDVCITWEKASTPTPVIPAQATYPNVPVLGFLGNTETEGTPLVEQSVALFQNSTLLFVAEGMHEPVESNQCAAGLATHFIETLEVSDTSCANTPEIVWPAVGRFPLVAADARPAEVNPGSGNQIGAIELKVVTVAVNAVLDALKRSALGSGSGVGLRAGNFQTTFDSNGNQTTTLTNCAFANDVTVNGTVLWRSDRSVVADVTVTGSGTAGGHLHVEGAFELPGPVGNFNISGKLGGREVAALVPEA